MDRAISLHYTFVAKKTHLNIGFGIKKCKESGCSLRRYEAHPYSSMCGCWLLWAWKHWILLFFFFKSREPSENLLLFPDILLGKKISLQTCSLYYARKWHPSDSWGKWQVDFQGSGNHLQKAPKQNFLLRLVASWQAWWHNSWDASVPDVLYTFFGNHYYLHKWARTLTGWMDSASTQWHI